MNNILPPVTPAPNQPQFNRNNNHLLVDDVLDQVIDFIPASERYKHKKVCTSFNDTINRNRGHLQFVEDVKATAHRIYELLRANIFNLEHLDSEYPFPYTKHQGKHAAVSHLLHIQRDEENNRPTIVGAANLAPVPHDYLPIPRENLNNSFRLYIKATRTPDIGFYCLDSIAQVVSNAVSHILGFLFCFTAAPGIFLYTIIASDSSDSILESVYDTFFLEPETITCFVKSVRNIIIGEKKPRFSVKLWKRKLTMNGNAISRISPPKYNAIFKETENKNLIEEALRYLNTHILNRSYKEIDRQEDIDTIPQESLTIRNVFTNHLEDIYNKRQESLEKANRLETRLKEMLNSSNSEEEVDELLHRSLATAKESREILMKASAISIEELEQIEKRLVELETKLS